MSKRSMKLTGVPQTLLLPLLGRAKLSEAPWSPVHDELACELVKTLDYDFQNLLKKVGDLTLFWMARAYHFDETVKQHLKKYPNAVIINLGAGLETAFFRVDNGQMTWIDLDLPEVITLKKSLLPENNRLHYLAKSVLDLSWMEDVKQYGDNLLFTAGGLFMYFKEDEVKHLMTSMAEAFPSSELFFDVINKRSITYANDMLQNSKMDGAVLQWPLNDAKSLESWSDHIKLLAQFSYFKDIKTKANIPLYTRLKLFFFDLIDKSCVHLKFGKRSRDM